MAERSDVTRSWAYALVFAGALLLVAALLLPTFLLNRLEKTPLDLRITTIAVTDGSTGSVAETASVLTPSAKYKVDENVPLVSQRFLTTEEPSNADKVTIQAGSSLRRTDVTGNTGLLTATVDRVTLDRKSGEAIQDPVGSIQTDADGAFTEVEHHGLLWRFPFDTEKKTYDFFDLNIRTANPIDFVEETEINGTKVYKFQQTIAPTKVSDHVDSPINRVTKTVENWDIAPKAGETPETPVTMDRYYTNVRTIWVEPRTGTVIKGSEAPHQYFARDANSGVEKTLLNGELAYDEETVENQIHTAKDATDTISLVSRTVPIILGVLGILALLAGLFLGLRGKPSAGGRRRAGSGPSGVPAVTTPEADDEPATEVFERPNLDPATDVIRRPDIDPPTEEIRRPNLEK